MHEIDSGYPLSPEQQVALDAGRPAAQLRIALTGALDEQRLRQALLALVARHESLRMAQRASKLYRGLRQHLIEAELDWQTLDLRNAADSLEARVAELCAQPFALDSGRLLRAVLVRLDQCDWQLALSLAPSAGDRLSLETLFAELPQVYEQPYAELEEVVQYTQFIDWRAELEADAEAETGRAYWADLGLEQLPALRLGYRRQAQANSHQSCLSQALPAALAAELERLAEARQQPLPTLLQAVWWALLARIGGQPAFAGGWQHDCRHDYEALAGGVGVFDKVLPLPLRLEPSEAFSHWLQRLAVLLEDHVGAQEYWSLNEPQQAHLSAGFALATQPAERLAAGLNWCALALPGTDPRFELALQVRLADSGIALALHHDNAHYGQDDARCLLEQYLCLLQQLPAHADAPIAELNLSPAAHRSRQLALCGAARDFGSASLPARLAHWAALTPEAEALQAGELRLSYRELNERVERLAAALQARGVGAESRVALLLPRSAELVLALLATLRAGAAYVPLDPNWPAARLQKILVDAQPQLLLSESPREDLHGHSLRLADLLSDSQAELAPLDSIRLEHAAYLLYTSGTSGEPKGVVIEHRQLLNYSAAVSEALELNACRRFALTSSVAADLGNTSLFGALWNGACLVVASDVESTDAAAFARFLRAQRIDCLKMVPSHLAALLEDEAASLPATLILGGEATPPALLERIRGLAPSCRIHNHYGPTETTVGLLVHSLGHNPCADDSLPLDRALANGYAYVLEAGAEGLRPAPLGAVGELYLGGAQLSRGYLNRESDAFIDDPLRPGQRLYRSGDRARLLPDGRLQLLGRLDQQLKIRGFRVEPDELEAALLALAGVSQAAVKVAGEQLHAYVVSQRPVDELLSELRGQLPDYLQPTRLLKLAALPRMANGKIDRQALPDPSNQDDDSAMQAPRDALETLLANLYAELLERDAVGTTQSLFDLGGHSLMVIKLCARLRKLLQIEVAPGLVFDHPSVATLAQAMRGLESVPGRLEQIAELRLKLAAMTPEERAALQARAKAAEGQPS
ncbi:non-ribosomal peptide synthetase [Pseudomonas anguilliseptica]|uniref:Amino acid adenylation domain-containing protein n=1 Tax=Pseudomonas anguilliseptica TaxID=53406 RepID=A0A1H5BT97_PSEAG|nr:amino acid adenylation domain-containing protein [Pseudomonas anguilliseptica]SED57792.1 amino acid adenylation domain-containing protein [Pseudomonas anguilliseptica]